MPPPLLSLFTHSRAPVGTLGMCLAPLSPLFSLSLHPPTGAEAAALHWDPSRLGATPGQLRPCGSRAPQQQTVQAVPSAAAGLLSVCSNPAPSETPAPPSSCRAPAAPTQTRAPRRLHRGANAGSCHAGPPPWISPCRSPETLPPAQERSNTHSLNTPHPGCPGILFL